MKAPATSIVASVFVLPRPKWPAIPRKYSAAT